MTHSALRMMALACFFSLIVSLASCSRTHYRLRADQEVAELVAEKSNDPRWAMPANFNIGIDPRSRYYDPYDPDRPPMPPDDPDSHVLMHYIDGMPGYRKWHRYGHIQELENPCWRQYLSDYARITPDGKIRLGLNDALALAYLHSPDFQEELETLYLSALDVSSERFAFDVQFFGGNTTTYDSLGPEQAGGPLRQLTTTSDAQFTRQFAGAGEFLVGLANSFVWEFSGDTNTALSVLNFSLIQPLLRGGGRAVALEQLTLAERTLLANLRAMTRFRQGFYTDVAIGQSGVGGPQRLGGFFGGTGLTGFTGQGGGFGGVGAASGLGGGGGGGGGATGGGAGFAGGGAGNVGGFIGLIQRLQQIRNTEASLRAQQQTLQLLEANLAAGLIDIAQVDQFRQNIETERANLLQARNGLEATLDGYKTDTLGLPPDLEFELDDSLIRQFQLLSPETQTVSAEIAMFVDQFGDLPEEPTLAQLKQAIAALEQLKTKVALPFGEVEQDLARMEQARANRIKSMEPDEQERYEQDTSRLYESRQELQKELQAATAELETLAEGLNEDTRVKTADGIVAVAIQFSNVVNGLGLVQARARLESLVVERILLPSRVGLEIARASRLDWMNNRAALVDSWRLIEFNANALQSDLTVSLSGEMQSLGDNPVKFRDQNGILRAQVEFDGPFTRLLERNNFRQQLIQYQQDRRSLIQFEDGIHQNLRQILRTLEQLRINLEIQRRAVAIAIRRVDQTRENLNRPVPPALPGQLPQALGPTAAQNLLFALSDLRNTQNNLMSVWLNYLAARMQLYRELGVMEVDAQGRWIDVPFSQIYQPSAEEIDTPSPAPQEMRELPLPLETVKQLPLPAPTTSHLPPEAPREFLEQAASWTDNLELPSEQMIPPTPEE